MCKLLWSLSDIRKREKWLMKTKSFIKVWISVHFLLKQYFIQIHVSFIKSVQSVLELAIKNLRTNRTMNGKVTFIWCPFLKWSNKMCADFKYWHQNSTWPQKEIWLWKLKLKSYSHLSKNSFICFNESPLQMMKNDFCVTLKAFLVLKIFDFLSWIFGHAGKTA